MRSLSVILCKVWLVAGFAVWFYWIGVTGLWLDWIRWAFHMTSPPRQHGSLLPVMSLMFFAFASAGVFGALLTLKNRGWGPPILYVNSAFGLLYGAVFLLAGGISDTGLPYAIAVGLIIVLSWATLFGVRRDPAAPGAR
jgi:hypothetical protein